MEGVTAGVEIDPQAVDALLDSVGLRILRYLGAFEVLSSQISQLSVTGGAPTLGELNQFARDATDPQVRTTTSRSKDEPSAGGFVDLDEPRFRQAVALVQEDIRQVLELHYGGMEYDHLHELNELLTMSPHELEQAFGSVSHAWDTLVLCKHKLMLPDSREFALGSWHIACVSEAERLMRETVSLCFAFLGPGILRKCLVQCFDVFGTDVSVSQILDYGSTAEAAAQLMLEHMRQSSTHTLDVAYLVAKELGVSFLPDAPGFSPGLLELLSWVPSYDPAATPGPYRSVREDELTETEKKFGSPD
jgi:hypothetical protein